MGLNQTAPLGAGRSGTILCAHAFQSRSNLVLSLRVKPFQFLLIQYNLMFHYAFLGVIGWNFKHYTVFLSRRLFVPLTIIDQWNFA